MDQRIIEKQTVSIFNLRLVTEHHLLQLQWQPINAGSSIDWTREKWLYALVSKISWLFTFYYFYMIPIWLFPSF